MHCFLTNANSSDCGSWYSSMMFLVFAFRPVGMSQMPPDNRESAGKPLASLHAGMQALPSLAIGAMSIGRLKVPEARIETLSIGTLPVNRLNILSE